MRVTPYFLNLKLTLTYKKYHLGRVVVTSSPLYQPMDEMERLGYELRVYVRVPDLGMKIYLFQKLKFLLLSYRRWHGP